MKIKIQRANLLEALKKVQAGANAKTTMPILGNVAICAADGQMVLTTTNLDLTLVTKIDCTVEEPGQTTVPMKMMMSIVSAMIDGEVEMELGKNRMKVHCGSYVTQVGALPFEDFPKMAELKEDFSSTLKTTDVRDILKKTSYAMCPDDTRRTLASTLLEFTSKLVRSVATDGRRLAVAQKDGEYAVPENEVRQLIVPSAAINSIMRFCEGDGEITIASNGKMIWFTTDEGKNRIISKLIDGQYPNYGNVIPKETKAKAMVDRADLIGAVERVSVMATRDDSCIKMTFDANMLKVEVKGDDYCDAHDDMAVKYQGEKVEIIFNPRYVLEPLRNCVADEVAFELTDGLHPANIKSDTEKFLCTLMPLRVANS